MIGLPEPGERVTFRACPGHRVPREGRPGEFYKTGEPVTEPFTQVLYSRLMTGAIELLEWSGKPKPAESPPAEEK